MKPNVKKFLPVIIGVLLTIPLAIGAFFLTQGALTRAGSVAPADVRILAITGDSAVITWTTSQESQANVTYGLSPTQLIYFAPEISPKMDHRVELTLLEPQTTYFFKIVIGDEEFDNEGIAWTFTTQPRTGVADGPLASPSAGIVQPLATDEAQMPSLTPLPTVIFTQAPANMTPTKKLIMGCPKTTRCELIKSKLGKGCSTAEYVKCMNGSNNPTSTAPTGSSGSNVTPTLAPPINQ